MILDVQMVCNVKYVKEKTSRKGNKYYDIMAYNEGRSIWLKSPFEISEGRHVLSCKISQNGEYLNISCIAVEE